MNLATCVNMGGATVGTLSPVTDAAWTPSFFAYACGIKFLKQVLQSSSLHSQAFV